MAITSIVLTRSERKLMSSLAATPLAARGPVSRYRASRLTERFLLREIACADPRQPQFCPTSRGYRALYDAGVLVAPHLLFNSQH